MGERVLGSIPHGGQFELFLDLPSVERDAAPW